MCKAELCHVSRGFYLIRIPIASRVQLCPFRFRAPTLTVDRARHVVRHTLWLPPHIVPPALPRYAVQPSASPEPSRAYRWFGSLNTPNLFQPARTSSLSGTVATGSTKPASEHTPLELDSGCLDLHPAQTPQPLPLFAPPAITSHLHTAPLLPPSSPAMDDQTLLSDLCKIW